MKLDVNKVNTNYQIIGKGKTTLVLLHGWGCDWQIWHPVIIELSKKYKLIIPDLPTFGESGEPTKVWDLLDYATWLEKFIKLTVKDSDFILLGHSFGGQIASVYAVSSKTRHLKKLILVDSAGLADSLSNIKKVQVVLLGLVPDKIKQLTSSKIRKNILKIINSPTDYLESSLYQRKVLKKVVRENIAKYLIKIETPTQLIWGRNDNATPIHQGEKFNKLIKNSKLEIFENSGHFPFIDEPIKFINIIS